MGKTSIYRAREMVQWLTEDLGYSCQHPRGTVTITYDSSPRGSSALTPSGTMHMCYKLGMELEMVGSYHLHAGN